MKTLIKITARSRRSYSAFKIAGWIMGVTYVCVLTGLTLGSVGKITETSVWTFQNSVITFFIVAIPFALGLMASSGKN